MSNLDDKLQKLYLEWHDGRRPLSGYLKDIEKLFANEGYEPPVPAGAGIVMVETMTGQEWFSRFEKELQRSARFPTDQTVIDFYGAKQAAKRAAGLES